MNGAPSPTRLVQPCWYCAYWAGVAESGVNGLCTRDGRKLQAQPEHGCAFYVREPGSDDDGWRPVLQGKYDMGASFAANVAPERERAARAILKVRPWWEEPPRPRRPAAAPSPVFVLPSLGSVAGFYDLDE